MAASASRNMVVFFLGLFVLLLPLVSGGAIHEILRSKGLPEGLLPKAVKSFSLDESGRLDVYLDRPCYAKFDNRVLFDSVVRGNLSYGALTGMAGLSQEELFLWLPVKDIKVEDPGSGVILFDIGVAHKQLSISLFEYPPDCSPEDADRIVTPSSGFLGRKAGREGTAEQR
ncbi:uncharacterized protein LOC116265729 [Nymphaea colorata]|uniref:uncharacterized protein LOC116265729 n=1 Tax=Nymphaea colorata TaxID=210225 RepID=UPI00129E48E2|nr:uncharacterized protein LOC116265729 [Nymphaea colorata]